MTVAKEKSDKRAQTVIKNAIEATTTDLIGLADRFDSFPNFPLDRTEINKLDLLKSRPFLIPCEKFKRSDWKYDFIDLIIISLITTQLVETGDKIQLVKVSSRASHICIPSLIKLKMLLILNTFVSL
ncbi:hypothetical protein DSO57_1022340 [Entomophthora muscae]|uniref:Uncharacterized protein n=1 Tax=Entomophthora muscae TaxID=34485 RepID=A0ACC2U1J6_9FUNG|nr:hypothetical protein DSO57_1022340 [Entomophthora muscae]